MYEMTDPYMCGRVDALRDAISIVGKCSSFVEADLRLQRALDFALEGAAARATSHVAGRAWWVIAMAATALGVLGLTWATVARLMR